MSYYGDTVLKSFEDPTYTPDLATVQSLAKNADASDSEVIEKIVTSVGFSKSEFAQDFANVAQNLDIDGKRISQAPNFNKQQLADVFTEPTTTFFGGDDGLTSRNKLLMRLIEEKLDPSSVKTNEDIFRQNSSLVESVIVDTASGVPFLDAYLYGLVGGPLLAGLGLIDSPFNGPVNAGNVNARLSSILGNTAEPSLSEQQEAEAEQISDAVAKQCVLLNLLQPLNDFYDEILRYQPDTQNLPYGGKIIKFKCDPVSHFTNYLTAVGGTNNFYTSKRQSKFSYLAQPIVDVRLSFIRSDENGGLIELPIINSSNKITTGETTLNKPTDGSSIFQNDGGAFGGAIKNPAPAMVEAVAPDEGLEAIAPAFKALQNVNFHVDISYEGTNPSTARNDVDVVVKFRASSIEEFNKTWSYDYNPEVNYSLFDLILFPFYDKDADGYGKTFRSQFSPNYNRMRLYYRARANATPQSNNPPSALEAKEAYDWYLKNSNVLDLTVIDHDFTRNGETDEYELTITYKGYVQSLLTRPETDALSDSAIKGIRKNREQLIEAATQKGCTQAEINKIITSLNTAAQADIKDVSAAILKDLFKRSSSPTGRGIFCLNKFNIEESLKDGSQIRLDEIKKHIVTNTPITNTNTTNLANAVPDPGSQLNTILESTDNIYFFYISDLLDVILEHSDLFTSGGVSTSKYSIRQELKFILGSFLYTDSNANTYNINIGHVPISLDFFKEWYQETIVDKNLFIYPCLSFIRDLFERVLTNLLSEVCFKSTEDQRFLVRTAFFAGSKLRSGRFQFVDDAVYDFYYSKVYENIKILGNQSTVATMNTTDNQFFPLITNDFDSSVNDYNNYCVIYVQGPIQVGESADQTFVTNFHINNGEVLGERDFSFSKTDQTGLREARYFRNSSSGITMLSSVYNTTVNLEVPLCFLYPGNFYQITMEGTGGRRPNFKPSRNSPSFFIFQELGIDGYYVITKSKYSLQGAMNNLEAAAEISGIWVSSDNPLYNLRESNPTENRIITDPTALTSRSDCKYAISMAEEISAAALAGDQAASNVTANQIDSIFDISQRTSAEDELLGPIAVAGYGDQTERAALLDAAKGLRESGQLSSTEGTINYKVSTDDEDNISVIDQSNGNIIGVFQTDKNGNLVFSENPDYFGEAN
jgi:hypothetical protein